MGLWRPESKFTPETRLGHRAAIFYAVRGWSLPALAAAVRHGRIGEAIEAIGKKGWKDAWRPIHEALRAAESGSPEYLKRVAVEIRDPASVILGRIAPNIR